ncbi:MAG: TonB-dependent receptor [Saprospiraceae bacterium]|nr:TonB-dependent receptor [Saprospiraceae bacterium]
MNFKSIFILTLVLGLSNIINSQVLVGGKVKDKSSGQPVIGALIEINKNGTSTDENGNFSLSLPVGFHQLTIEAIGYKLLVKKILVAENENQFVEIELEGSNILLDVAEISTSRSEKPLAESPVSIDIIQSRSAERLNSVSAEQVIDKVPGVQIIDGQANIRGGSGYSYGAGSRVMLIMDDLQILQPDAAFTNWSDLPLENVGQIEIVKGAASALFGSAAMNGVIHFRNVKPSINPYTSVSYITRFYMKPKLKNEWWGNDSNHVIPSEQVFTFAHRQKFQKLDLTFGSMYRNEVSFNKGKGIENFRLNGTATYHFTDRLIGEIGANVNTGTSTGFFYWNGKASFVGDPTSYSSSKRTRFNIDPSIQYFTKDNYRLKLLTRLLYVNNNNNGNQSNQSENYFTEGQIQKKFESIGLEFVSGVVYNYSNVDAPLYSDSIFISRNIGLYTQLEKTLFRNLLLSAGVRYEYNILNGPSIVNGSLVENPIIDDRPVFRMGLNYQPINGTYIRSSFGQGFRFPSLAEKFIETNAGGIRIIPNLNLHSERGNSYEIGVKQGIKFGNYQGFFDFSYFDSRYEDMIEFTLVVNKLFQAYYQAQNVGGVRIKGVEFSNQAILELNKSKIIYNIGFTLMDPKFRDFDLSGKDLSINNLENATQGQLNAFASTSSENILKYRSKQLVRSDIEYQWEKIYFGLNFTFASHVQAIDKIFESGLITEGIKEFREEHNKGYELFDFRCGVQFNKLDFQLNVQNAFNEVYTLRPGLMEAPRSLGGRVVYSFQK